MKVYFYALMAMSLTITQLYADSESSDSEVDEIVVTSSILNTSRILNPLYVIDGDEINDDATTSLGEAVDSYLGVSIADYGAAVGQPIIRGMSGPRVKILKNGMVNRDVSGLGVDHLNDVDLHNVEQIEIIKGPSSLLYANGTNGGIINVVNNTIAREDFAGQEITFGLESQSVNDGDIQDFHYENIIGDWLNVSIGYQNTELGNFDIPDGAVIHDDHDDHDDHDEHGEEAALDMTLRVTSLDWKYVNEKNDNIELAIGGNFIHQTNENHGEEVLVPNATKNDMGLFMLSHFHFDSSDLMLGVRADMRQIDAIGIEKTYTSMTASAGYKKDLGQSSIFRLNLATGYRAPNLSELFSDGEHHGTGRYEIGSSELSVEKNFQTDISFETSNEKSSLLVDLFYNNINDYIFLNPTGAQTDEFMPVYEYSQSDATILGGEIAYSSKTGIDWLSYYASMEYLRGKKKNDGWLPDIPPVTFKLNLDLDFTEKINYAIDILHKARQDKVATFENSTHSNFLVDVSGQYDLNTSYPGARAQLFWKVENVFDKYYYDHLSRFKNYGFYDMGRNVSIGLKISY